MADDLDSILNDSDDTGAGKAPEAKPEADEKPEGDDKGAEAKAEPAGEADKAEPDGEDGDTGAKPADEAAKPEDAPPASKDEPKTVPIVVLHKERDKTEAQKSRADVAEAALANLRNQALAKPPERPDALDDPDGAAEFDKTQHALEMVDLKVNNSWTIAERTIPDFAEVTKVGQAVMAERPSLYQEACASHDPAGFIYEECKKHLAAKEFGDPATYREKLKAEIKAELLAENAKAKEPVPDLPDSLAEERNAGDRSGPAWAGPEPLNEILPDT